MFSSKFKRIWTGECFFLILNCAICHTNLCLCVNALQTEVRRVYVFMSHFYVLIARKLIFLEQILKIQVQKKYYWRFSVARTWRPLIGDKVVRRFQKKIEYGQINRMGFMHVWHAGEIWLVLHCIVAFVHFLTHNADFSYADSQDINLKKILMTFFGSMHVNGAKRRQNGYSV